MVKHLRKDATTKKKKDESEEIPQDKRRIKYSSIMFIYIYLIVFKWIIIQFPGIFNIRAIKIYLKERKHYKINSSLLSLLSTSPGSWEWGK